MQQRGEPVGCGVWGNAGLVSCRLFNYLVKVESLCLVLDWEALLGDKSGLVIVNQTGSGL